MATLSKATQEAIAAAVATALTAAQSPSKPKGNSKPKGKQEKPRTIRNRDARASVKQVYLLCSKLHEAQFGASLPNPLTMGDVQDALDSLS